MTLSALELGLRDLLDDDGEDHRRVAAALSSEPTIAPAPADPELAALAFELRRLRWLEREAPAMMLLAAAAESHPLAVERHLAWISAGNDRAPEVIVLDDPAVTWCRTGLQLAS